MSIRVLLADDHKIVRQGLRGLLEKQEDVEVVGEAKDRRTTLKLVEQVAPDIVIMDVSMPDLNGIEATRQIAAKHPSVKVIGLSMYADRRFIKGMLNAGASGYLPKDCAFEELVKAVRAAVANQTYLSPAIADIVVREYLSRSEKTDSTAFSMLTSREREVLQLLAEGRSTSEIARRLSVSVKTVETHRQRIMTKLNVHSLAELTKYAIREGLTSLDR